MSYLELAMNFPEWNFGQDAIRNALKRRGYSRHISWSKLPLTDAQKILRLEWAHQHLHYNLQDWAQIVWSDETWTGDGPVIMCILNER